MQRVHDADLWGLDQGVEVILGSGRGYHTRDVDGHQAPAQLRLAHNAGGRAGRGVQGAGRVPDNHNHPVHTIHPKVHTLHRQHRHRP